MPPKEELALFSQYRGAFRYLCPPRTGLSSGAVNSVAAFCFHVVIIHCFNLLKLQHKLGPVDRWDREGESSLAMYAPTSRMTNKRWHPEKHKLKRTLLRVSDWGHTAKQQAGGGWWCDLWAGRKSNHPATEIGGAISRKKRGLNRA